LDEKEKLAEVAVVIAAGPLVIDVCGAVTSAPRGRWELLDEQFLIHAWMPASQSFGARCVASHQ